jgi:putative ABC transport system permease protein
MHHNPGGFMDALRQDVRFAIRSFVRRPAFAVSAVLSLALGIAASSAVFSVINAALFKPIPGVTKPERLVEISRDVNGDLSDVTWEVFDRLRVERSTLEDLGAFALVSASLAGEGEPVARAGLAVTGNYFELLGIGAAMGRTFAPDEASWPAIAPVALISHEAWQREFDGANDVIGRAVRINGVPVEVIGVLPERFAGHHTGLLIDVFLPLGLRIPGLPNPNGFTQHNASSVELLGRLVVGVSPGVAQRRLSEAADRFQKETPGTAGFPSYVIGVSEWGPLPGAIRGSVATFLTLLLVMVGLALAMACANVATVLLARAVDRQRELAVRRAIGATRQRLVRQLVTEVSVLFVVAGVTGVLLASWATGLLAGVAPPIPIPGRLGIDLGFDGRVLAFSLAITLGTALVFNLLPALSATRFDVVRSLREGASSDTRRRARLRSMLVGAQVAVTCTLLFATVLFGRALQTMRDLRPQWNVDGVLVTAIDLELNGTTREAGMAWQAEVRRRVSALPGVEAASWATKLPIGGRSSLGIVRPVGAAAGSGPAVDGSLNRVSPGYFRSMGIAVRRGRDFTDDDRDEAPRVAILNETMARGLFGNADPIGQRFYTGQQQYRMEFEVVGVAGDSRIVAPGRPADNALYIPLAQMYNSAAHLHVRSAPNMSAGVARAVRSVIRETSGSVPLPPLRPLADALELSLLPQRLAAWVAAVMGIFGLVLAGVGIYGVAAFAASRRSREVAIRMALGATDRDVTNLLVRGGARAPAAGLLIGLAIGTGLSAVAATVVPGVRVADPTALALVAIAVSLLSAGALIVPIRALLRGSPMRRLRED